MNLITLFLLINVCLNAVYVPGSPFYVAGADNCFYSTQNQQLNGTNPLIDSDNNRLENLSINNSDDLETEIGYPSNSTWIGFLDGVGNTFNSLYEAGEQLYKYAEIMRALLLSGFINNVIDNIVLNCYFDNNGTLTQAPGPEPAFWTTLKVGISAMVLFLLVLTIWYHLSGKGHLLTN